MFFVGVGELSLGGLYEAVVRALMCVLGVFFLFIMFFWYMCVSWGYRFGVY